MKKDNKKTINWFLVVSIGFYIGAIILIINNIIFTTKNNNTMVVSNLGLGSSCYCLSVLNSKKDNKNSKDNNKNSDPRK